MSAAYKCDLCDRLESGKPAQRVAITPEHGASAAFELCTICLASFNDWRVGRAPEQDRPE
jgi:hypothetical protein